GGGRLGGGGGGGVGGARGEGAWGFWRDHRRRYREVGEGDQILRRQGKLMAVGCFERGKTRRRTTILRIRRWVSAFGLNPSDQPQFPACCSLYRPSCAHSSVPLK